MFIILDCSSLCEPKHRQISGKKINLIVANRSKYIKKLQQCSFHPVLTDQKILNSNEVKWIWNFGIFDENPYCFNNRSWSDEFQKCQKMSFFLVRIIQLKSSNKSTYEAFGSTNGTYRLDWESLSPRNNIFRADFATKRSWILTKKIISFRNFRNCDFCEIHRKTSNFKPL